LASTTDRYLPIDEEGYFIFDGRRVDDEELGRALLESIEKVEAERYVTSMNGERAWVEAFDEPLIARHVAAEKPGFCTIDLPYRTQMRFALDTLSVDEWDRFHGVTDKQIPFVFSRGAQFEFFDLLDSFDDDSITVGGVEYKTPPWLVPQRAPDTPAFWTGIYKGEEPPGWEQGHESVMLPAVLPQLKLNKCRVLVLGAGSGHDAAYFAKQGHMVTAVDFSEEAVQRMRAKYSELDTLKIVQADVFNLPKEWAGRFDLVFEHTLYCAVAPDRRNELVKIWNRMLVPHGDILAMFFVHEKRTGPPWGGSERELRERLKGSFDFLFWTRWRQSVEARKSKELVVYARKRPSGHLV
jgi:SAM-dependent methyltransferase